MALRVRVLLISSIEVSGGCMLSRVFKAIDEIGDKCVSDVFQEDQILQKLRRKMNVE